MQLRESGLGRPGDLRDRVLGELLEGGAGAGLAGLAERDGDRLADEAPRVGGRLRERRDVRGPAELADRERGGAAVLPALRRERLAERRDELRRRVRRGASRPPTRRPSPRTGPARSGRRAPSGSPRRCRASARRRRRRAWRATDSASARTLGSSLASCAATAGAIACAIVDSAAATLASPADCGVSAPSADRRRRASRSVEHADDDVAVLAERLLEAGRDVVGVVGDELARRRPPSAACRAGRRSPRARRTCRRAAGSRRGRRAVPPRRRSHRSRGRSPTRARRPTGRRARSTRGSAGRARGPRRAGRAPTRRGAARRRGCRRGRRATPGVPAAYLRAPTAYAHAARATSLRVVSASAPTIAGPTRASSICASPRHASTCTDAWWSPSALISGATARLSPERPSVNVAASRIAFSGLSTSGSTSASTLGSPSRPAAISASTRTSRSTVSVSVPIRRWSFGGSCRARWTSGAAAPLLPRWPSTLTAARCWFASFSSRSASSSGRRPCAPMRSSSTRTAFLTSSLPWRSRSTSRGT